MGWLANAKPRSLYRCETDPVPIVQETGWAPGPVWTGAKISPTPGFDPQTVQPVAIRYSDYATPAHRFHSTRHSDRQLLSSGRINMDSVKANMLGEKPARLPRCP